jgi:SAP domain-containing protein
MSRHIDVSDPSSLTEADLQYLRDRGRLSEVAQLDHQAAIEAAKVIPVANERIANAPTRPPVPEELAPPRGADEVPPYEEWSRTDLRKECAARKLPTTGKHADLVARLEEDDQQNAGS